MATSAGDEFDTWLIVKLKSLNTDEGVFSSYIKGILEGDETDDEKNESLEGILSEITHCHEIFEQWRTLHHKDEEEASAVSHEDVDDRLVKLLENQAKPTIVARNYTEEEKKLRDAILAQYSQMSDQEDEQDDEAVNGSAGPAALSGAAAAAKPLPATGAAPKSGLTRNTNFDDVVRADRDRREKAKQDAQRKKEKDKEDREKQKKDQQDKKEKRKTQKGERRR
ncbi:hypothetical protein B566_EDAN015185 [Ephemera danica]|nr:hypothetical protein B566_EDAN015185 [Ephemera danica]